MRPCPPSPGKGGMLRVPAGGLAGQVTEASAGRASAGTDAPASGIPGSPRPSSSHGHSLQAPHLTGASSCLQEAPRSDLLSDRRPSSGPRPLALDPLWVTPGQPPA